MVRNSCLYLLNFQVVRSFSIFHTKCELPQQLDNHIVSNRLHLLLRIHSLVQAVEMPWEHNRCNRLHHQSCRSLEIADLDAFLDHSRVLILRVRYLLLDALN